jgi:hypothetical protein
MTYKPFCNCSCTSTQSQAVCPGKTMPNVLYLAITTSPVCCLNNFSDMMTCSVAHTAWYSPVLGSTPFGTLTFCQGVFIGANETSYFGLSCAFQFPTYPNALGNQGYFLGEFSSGSIQFGTVEQQFVSDEFLSCSPFHYHMVCNCQGAQYNSPWIYPTTIQITVDVTEDA